MNSNVSSKDDRSEQQAGHCVTEGMYGITNLDILHMDSNHLHSYRLYPRSMVKIKTC